MSDHEAAALAELDVIGRQAAGELREAARQATARYDGPAGAAGANGECRLAARSGGGLLPSEEDGGAGEPMLPDLELVAGEERWPVGTAGSGGSAGPVGSVGSAGRWRRVVLAAAVTAAVAGLVTARLATSDDRPQAETSVGAPTAALGDDPGGIYPPDAEHRGYEVASGDGTQVWDQWNLSLPPAGEHLLLGLQSGETTVWSVLAGLGTAPLQVGRVDAADTIPGADETAIFGSVDAGVMGTGRGGGSVTVERPGEAPVELHVEPVEGASQNLVVGFVPGDPGPDAEVVAVGPDGQEVGRVPVPAADEQGGGSPADSLFPDDPDHATVAVGSGGGEDPSWGAQVLEGGRYVLLGATGNEDSVSTVIERPGSTELQVLATRLDGHPDRPVVMVYGLVTADAAQVELTSPGRDPVPLRLEPIDGATHQAFGGEVPSDVPEGAEVVARDAAGREIERRPLAWTLYDVS
jgi:hypothetical protein